MRIDARKTFFLPRGQFPVNDELTIHILLADDNNNILKIAKQLLTTAYPFFAVSTVNSAEQALQRLEQSSFDILVSDYLMPGMDGLELLKTLRERGHTIPFIMFTSQKWKEIAIEALSLDIDYFLEKSGNHQRVFCELAYIIRSVVKHWAIEQALFSKN
ncbi:MAG: response regulator transcription factor [Candidatus Hodarchaeales archaeon]|jgi:DNA-binding NtrC family response regulator